MRKIEEIARALATADWRKNGDEFTERNVWKPGVAAAAYDLTNNSGRFHYDNLALAAVKAMREPTPQMIAAGWRQLKREHLPRLGPGPAFKEAFQAAVDAIIAEAEQEGE